MKKTTKEVPPTIHVSIGSELTTRLAGYVKNRSTNKSAVLQHALIHLFDTEFPTKAEQEAVKLALSEHFSIPKQIPYRAFFSFLYMLAEGYPDANSHLFWGELVSLSKGVKTNKQVYTELKDGINRLLAANAK